MSPFIRRGDIILKKPQIYLNPNRTWLECSLHGPLQNAYFFCVNRKSKMATTAGHSFSIAPYGKMKNIIFLRNYIFDWIQSVHEESFDSPLQKNCVNQKSNMATTIGHGNLWEKYFEIIFYHLKSQNHWMANMARVFLGWFFTQCVFVSIGIARWYSWPWFKTFNRSLPKKTPVSCLEVILYWSIVFWCSSTCILNLLRTLNIV